MKTRTLLLGASAALVATSGARAADPIVYAEPEPMEYVRICDVYGTGFYYIPGTETCLRISGYVRYQIDLSSENDYWEKSVRGRVNVDARTDTAWGTLGSRVRIQGDWDPNNQIGTVRNATGTTIGTFNYGTDGNAIIDQAYITLGGLLMGYTESAWDSPNDGGVAEGGSHSDSGLSYADQQRHLISYTFTGSNGFGLIGSLEDDGNSNYVPDLVGVAVVNQGWGGVWGKVAYDEDLAPAAASWLGARAAGLSGVDGWAASVGVQLNVPNSPGSSLRVIGFYSDNANAYSVGSEWSVLASYGHQFNPEFFASVGFQWFGDTNYGAAGSPDAWQGELNLVWVPITDFEVRAEYNYFDGDGANEVHSGFLRFTRFF